MIFSISHFNSRVAKINNVTHNSFIATKFKNSQIKFSFLEQSHVMFYKIVTLRIKLSRKSHTNITYANIQNSETMNLYISIGVISYFLHFFFPSSKNCSFDKEFKTENSKILLPKIYTQKFDKKERKIIPELLHSAYIDYIW